MIVTPDDVLAGVLAIWKSSPVAAEVPGGLHHGRIPNDADTPYALMKVTPGARMEFSGKAYCQAFTVTIGIYASAASPRTGKKANLLMSLLDRTQGLTVPNADSVLTVKPALGKLELAAEMQNSNNVLIDSAAWEIMIQGSRP